MDDSGTTAANLGQPDEDILTDLVFDEALEAAAGPDRLSWYTACQVPTQWQCVPDFAMDSIPAIGLSAMTGDS